MKGVAYQWIVYSVKKLKKKVLHMIQYQVYHIQNGIANIIFEHAKVPQGQRAITRAEFAEFINKFGVRNGINSRIQLTEFFVKLQELVMSEEELSKCY